MYGTQENLRYLKGHGIRFSGKPLGRPKKVTEANREELKRLKAQRREEYLQRIPIESKFGQGKNGYNPNYIRAERADTSYAWINSVFLVMNLLILVRIFFARIKKGVAVILVPLLRVVAMLLCHRRGHPTGHQRFVSEGNVPTYLADSIYDKFQWDTLTS